MAEFESLICGVAHLSTIRYISTGGHAIRFPLVMLTQDQAAAGQQRLRVEDILPLSPLQEASFPYADKLRERLCGTVAPRLSLLDATPPAR